jgi:uncharacterized protein (TIGR03067 family)
MLPSQLPWYGSSADQVASQLVRDSVRQRIINPASRRFQVPACAPTASSNSQPQGNANDGGDEEIPGHLETDCLREGWRKGAARRARLGAQVTFAGDTFIVTLADGTIHIKGTYKLDPSREPKAVDWTDTFGEDKGKVFLAIYSLEGDRMIFCAADAGQERPTEFTTRPGQVLRVHQRETW